MRWELTFQVLARGARRRGVWLGVPLLLYVWTFPQPFCFDDLHLLLKAEHFDRGERERLGLFEFATSDAEWRALIERGTLPWWAGAEGRISFVRPLAEWSFWADTRLFGRHAWGHRLMSLLWFAAALTCVRRMFRAADGDDTRAGVAAFLLGISQVCAWPAAFVYNRADLLVLVGTSLAGWAYCEMRRRPRWILLAVAVTGFVFALGSKEAAAPLAGVILGAEAWSRWRREDRAGDRHCGWMVIAIGLIAAGYVAYYAWMQPWRTSVLARQIGPTSSVFSLARTLGLYLTVWTVGFPVNALLTGAGSSAASVLAGVGVLLGGLTAWSLWKARARSAAEVFFVLWAALFFLLAMLTIAEPRALCIASVGWCYLLAGLLAPAADHRRLAPMWLRHWLWTANGLVSVACGLGAVAYAISIEKSAQGQIREALASQPRPLRRGDTLVIGEAATLFAVPFGGDRLEYLSGVAGARIAYLTVTGAGGRFERLDEHTLVVRSSSPWLFGSPMHRVSLGADYRPAVGQAFSGPGFVARIAELSRGAASAVEFRFFEPLTSERYHFWPVALRDVACGRAP